MVSRKKISFLGGKVQILLLAQLFFSISPAFAAEPLVEPPSDGRVRIYRYADFNVQQAPAGKQRLVTLSASTATDRATLNHLDNQPVLTLENNTQLTSKLPSSGIKLLRGTVEGKPGSWARLTHTASGTHGLVWDGKEMYAIEPSTEVRSALAVSLPQPSTDTVVFKLADTTVDLGAKYCGSEDHGQTADHSGMATYQALTGNMDQSLSTPTNEPTLILELQALADAAFRAQYSSDQAALDAIMVRLNNVDGIFTAQLGLSIVATDVEIHANDSFGLTDSTTAGSVLDSLGQLRNGTPVMRSYAATHLFTGRDLDGDTLGIAYIGNLCGARYAVSLSEIRNRGAWIDSLVAAHELGHQLGAIHDGTGACSGTAAQSYLMGAQINGSSQLSQCSRDSIFATMQYASCLMPVGAPDVSIGTATAQPQVKPSETLLWSLQVQNLGTGKAAAPGVHVDVPAKVTIDSANINGGSCVSSNRIGGGSVDCQIESLAALEARTLNLILHSDQAGSYNINVNVTTAADDNPANNAAVFVLNVASEPVPVTTTANSTATPPAPNNGGSGGGGVFGLGWLCLMTLSALRRRVQANSV